MAQTKPWALRCYQALTKARIKVNSVARKDVKGDDSARCRGRRQPKYRLASLPRYPQVGKTVEGEEIKERQS